MAAPNALSNASVARVASSATVVTLDADSGLGRRSMVLFNESTAILYVKWGSGASLTDYSVQIGPSGYYEFPQPIYRGTVTGIWAAANGFVQVTEGF